MPPFIGAPASKSAKSNDPGWGTSPLIKTPQNEPAGIQPARVSAPRFTLTRVMTHCCHGLLPGGRLSQKRLMYASIPADKSFDDVAAPNPDRQLALAALCPTSMGTALELPDVRFRSRVNEF